MLLHAGQAIIIADQSATVISKIGGALAVAGLLDIADVENGQLFDVASIGVLQGTPAVGIPPIDVFISAATGSDTNPGTQLAPFATIDHFYATYPSMFFGGGQINLWIADSEGNFSSSPVYSQTAKQQVHICQAVLVKNMGAGIFDPSPSICYRGPHMVLATLTTGSPAGAVISSTSIPALTKKTRVTFTPDPGWTANEFKPARDSGSQKFARFRNGTNLVVYEAPISSNTSNTLDIDFDDLKAVLDPLIGAVSTEIVVPGALIQGVPNAGNVCNIIGDVAGGRTWPGFAGVSTFERLAFNVGTVSAGATFDRCVLTGGNPHTGNRETLACWGIGVSFVNSSCTFGMNFLGKTSLYYAIPRPDSALSPANQPTTTALAMELILHNMGLNIGLDPNGSVIGGQYKAWRNISVYQWSATNFNVGNTDGGIVVSGPGSSFQSRLTTAAGIKVAIQGTSSIGVYGLWAKGGALISIDSPNANAGLITIAGTSGALAVDTGAPVAYGVAAGNFEEVIGWNGNFTRMLEGTATHPTGTPSRISTLALQ